MTFTASATAQGYAFTDHKTLVTATATATGISEISYEEAFEQATELAQDQANLTAIYDANLINQATTEANAVATEKMNYNMMQISSPPDLTFYYSINNLKENVGSELIGIKSLLITSFGNIYSDENLTNQFGLVNINEYIYEVNENKEFYNTQKTKTFNLPGGTLTIFITTPSIPNTECIYYTLPGIYLYQIVSGTGDYLNKTGIVTINIDNDKLLRTINVYFNNY